MPRVQTLPNQAGSYSKRRIRREYAHVAEPTYRAARRHVLEQFLARPEIYGVPAIRAELEASARANLERRIAELC